MSSCGWTLLPAWGLSGVVGGPVAAVAVAAVSAVAGGAGGPACAHASTPLSGAALLPSSASTSSASTSALAAWVCEGQSDAGTGRGDWNRHGQTQKSAKEAPHRRRPQHTNTTTTVPAQRAPGRCLSSPSQLEAQVRLKDSGLISGLILKAQPRLSSLVSLAASLIEQLIRRRCGRASAVLPYRPRAFEFRL